VEEIDRSSATEVEVFTVEYHLVGHVKTGGRRFSNWLNLGDAQTFTVEDVALRSLHDLDRAAVKLGYVLVNRDAILAIIPRDLPAATMGDQIATKPLEYVEKEQHEVVVSVPPFALRGQMHLAKTADLQRALITFSGTFIPLTKARIVYTARAAALWDGEVILFNRDRAQLYWPSPADR
jgi:hypothetical protein